MANNGNAAKSLAEGTQSILDRVGEFFHIFDLSFFVAGAVTLAAAAFVCVKAQLQIPYSPPTWLTVAAFLIGSYAAGLMTFAIGRNLSGKTFRKGVFEKEFKMCLWAHEIREPAALSYYHTRIQTQASPEVPGAVSIEHRQEFLSSLKENFPKMTDQEFIELLSKQRDRLWWLYLRMWQDMAFNQPKSAPFRHLSRYWVMAATYDGLAIAFIAWAGAAILGMLPAVAKEPLSPWLGIALLLIFVFMAVIALKQGADYYRYQIQDLVAAISASRSSMTSAK